MPLRMRAARSPSVIVLSRIAHVELRQIAVHVCGAHVVIGADDAALEDAEKVLGGVAVVAAATAELAVAVDGRLMAGELAADADCRSGHRRCGGATNDARSSPARHECSCDLRA